MIFEESDIISSYSRAQAIDDGVLIDVPINALAQELGIKFHCAMTVGLYSRIMPAPTADHWQSLKGRVWDMLKVYRFMVRLGKIEGSVGAFRFKVSGRWVHVKAVCGPGDDAEPVITFMLPEED